MIILFKNKKRKHRKEDLNQKVCKYQRWWQDQTEEFGPTGSNLKKGKNPQKSHLEAKERQKLLDDSFVYYEEN